jgi:hypothetical protein
MSIGGYGTVRQCLFQSSQTLAKICPETKILGIERKVLGAGFKQNGGGWTIEVLKMNIVLGSIPKPDVQGTDMFV